MILTSCIKDEPQNAECDILEAWVEGNNLASHFIQATDMRISGILREPPSRRPMAACRISRQGRWSILSHRKTDSGNAAIR